MSKGRTRTRTQKTYNNKLSKLKKFYRRLNKGGKFSKKYPNFESFLEKVALKKPGMREQEYKPTQSTYTATRSVWGR